MSNNKQTHGFCKIPHKKCTLSYCDENGCIYDGCIYERRNLVGEPIEMSNNKQSSVDYYITKSIEILGPEINKQISRDDNERIARLEKQAKAMHEEEIIESWSNGYDEEDRATSNPFKYYNEKFGDQQ